MTTPRTMPAPTNLADAVRIVIASNKADGYPPRRFISATKDGYAVGLQMICERLISKGETLEWLENALQRYPMLLTLEDLVARYGLGMSENTLRSASDRAAYFDRLVGRRRYT